MMDNSISINTGSAVNKPNLPARLFWEFKYEKIDWRKYFELVIERVLDRGNQQEIDELIRFYGKEKVLKVFKDHPIYLMDHCIDRACSIFEIKKEDTVCYKRKVARGRGWF